jgi:hypothetical protein
MKLIDLTNRRFGLLTVIGSCNSWKSALSTEAFEAHVTQVYNHLHNMKCMKVGA